MLKSKIDRETMKQSNRKKILNLVYLKKEITKQEIAKTLRLSIPTVISNVNELIEENLLEEAGVATSTGGRKPVIIRFVEDGRFSFGVDISPRGVRIVLINLCAQIKAEQVFKIEKEKDIENIMIKIKACIEDMINQYHIPSEKILGVGFSLPGTVDEEKLILENAPNLGMKNVDFNVYKTVFGFSVYIENEANAAAYAESVLGFAKEKSNLIYLSITEGIGAGIIIHDHLYKGINKKAGEFGHMKISNENRQCNCGRRGCWELYASEKALLTNYNEKVNDPVEGLSDLFIKYKQNDKNAVEVVEAYIDDLSMGIQNIILGLVPEYIIIGGKISFYEDILIEKLKNKVYLENGLYTTVDTQIVFSQLGENASILGAALLPVHRLFNFNNHIL